ncbi:MAG: hypothetical protein K5761_00980 [Clostridiales bacterium]|nr:hypothetical protein [Clostridiales bacterium]
MSDTVTKKHKGTHKSAMPVGIIIVIFALVGLVTAVYGAIFGIRYLVDKSKNYEGYNKMLTPVVLIDPTNFDDITHADMSELIEISIWSILKSDISPEKYESGSGGLVIPKADVEKAFTKLFGSEVKPKHASIEGYDYEFIYDADKGTYTVPLTSVTPIYTPDVISISKSSDSTVLTVAMISGDGWEQGENGKLVSPSPDKYIKVTLRTVDGKSYISAIQTTTTPEVATVDDNTTETESESLTDQAELIASETEAVSDSESTETNKAESESKTEAESKNETQSSTKASGE